MQDTSGALEAAPADPKAMGDPGVSTSRTTTASASNGPGYARIKSVLDRTLSLILLILLSPIMLVAMALVRLTSSGPAIYKQVRLGRDSKEFTVYKLRTMTQDSERSGPQWSQPGDPRVTSLGRILRATHLDEIPQLVNVLRGEMSLIGPRPERPEIITDLRPQITDYDERLRVLPGLSGLAQIQLPPDTDLESVRRKQTCDVHYVAHYSFWLDLRIFLATILMLLGLSTDRILSMLDLPSLETITANDESESLEIAVPNQPAAALGSRARIANL